MSRLSQSLVVVAIFLAVAGCIRPPLPLQGTYEPLSVGDAQEKASTGSHVRWGGSIVSVTPHAEETCFEIVSHPLDAAARPRDTDDTGGRFIACIAGFYDPAIYEAGRELTVVGSITGEVEGKIGERDYRFPRVAATDVYLWPKREPQVVYRPVYDPFWYPYWWGPRYRPWYR